MNLWLCHESSMGDRGGAPHVYVVARPQLIFTFLWIIKSKTRDVVVVVVALMVSK